MTAGLSRDAARQAAARAGLAGAREPDAVGPGPQTETLRTAYLDVLKLGLCDLTGTTTVSVGALPDGTVVSRELSGYQLRLRAAGMDWPLQGLTMTGLSRLDDLQACVESVVGDGVEGDLIEAGAWRGGASILMRATLDSLGDERSVWVADSFEGFNASIDDRSDQSPLSAFDFLAVNVDDVKANFARFGLQQRVRFLPGFFADTLPDLSDRRWAIVRLDGDTYEATQVALRSLYPGLAPGGYLIVDDYGAFDECREAVDEFRRELGITEPLESVDWTCVRWRRQSDAIAEPAQSGGSPARLENTRARIDPPARPQLSASGDRSQWHRLRAAIDSVRERVHRA